MSLFQPNDAVELTRRNEKRLNRLERRANFGGQVSGLTNRGLDNLIINGDFRINQRGYISGATLTPGLLTGYAHDRWRTAGIVNLVRNPSAETNLTDWVATSAVTTLTRGNAQALFGSWSFTSTANSSGNNGIFLTPGAGRPRVRPNVPYTVSAYGRVNVVRDAVISVSWLDNAGIVVGTETSVPVAMSTTGWTRISLTSVSPATAATVAISVIAQSSVSTNVFYVDGVMLTETATLVPYIDGSQAGMMWLGTADASASMNRPQLTSYTFTQAPNGCTITLNSGGAVEQVIERASIPAGDYTLSWGGAAQARVYKNSDLTLLASATSSPLTFTSDGTDDIVIEFEAVGGTATLANVALHAGTTAYPFRPRPIGEELALAQRYFYAIPVNELVVHNPYWNVGLSGGGQFTSLRFPVPMRVAPILARASDGASVATFTYFDRGAAAPGSVAVRINAGATITPYSVFQLLYSSSDNGGSSLAAGRTIGYNTQAIHATAEF